MHRAGGVVGDAEHAARRGSGSSSPPAPRSPGSAGSASGRRRRSPPGRSRRSSTVGRDQGHRAERGGLAEAGADLAVGAALEQRPVHVAGAAAHRGAGEDVLADRVVEEAGRGEDRDPARLDLLGGDDALGAAEVVDVAVGVDQPGDRALAAVLAVEGERRGRGLGRDQRVDDDDALARPRPRACSRGRSRAAGRSRARARRGRRCG